ncbi:MAG: lipase family protein [Planctomycetales bacterium]
MSLPPGTGYHSRRQFLTATTSGLLGLTLARHLPAEQAGSKLHSKLTGHLVHQLALCSAAAYQPKAITDYANWKSTSAELLGEPFAAPEEDIRGFVARHEFGHVIAFRGTVLTQKKNLKSDLAFGPVSIDPQDTCKVHKGFHLCYCAVKEQLQAILKKFKPRRLMITGHSLGGALALLAANDLQAEYPNLIVCTFGQPRVGDKALSQRFKGRLYRFINDFDPIPHIPILNHYIQFGESVWFDQHQHVSSKRAMGVRLALESATLIKELRDLEPEESLSDFAKRKGAAGGKKLVAAILNHRLDGETGYLAALRKNLNEEY